MTFRIQPRASSHLDLLRVVAAGEVLLGHARHLFFVEFGQSTHRSPLIQAFYFVTGLEHYAVTVFFVLSGLLVGSSVVNAVHAGRWGWQPYLIARLVRLCIVLMPALVLVALIDQAVLRLPNGPDFYAHTIPQLDLRVVEHMRAVYLVGNAFFLQEILVPTYGSNVPLWSLSYEFWYYMLFPMLVLAWMPLRSTVTRVLYGSAAIAIALFIGPVLSAYFLIWLVGVGFVLGTPKTLSRGGFRLALGAEGLVLAVVLVLVRSEVTIVHDILVTLALVPLLWLVLFGDPSGSRAPAEWYHGLTKYLAGFSYTLYLTHLPLLFVLRVMTGPYNRRWQPDVKHLGLYAGACAAAVAFAWLSSMVTEQRTNEARAWVAHRLRREESLVAAKTIVIP